MGIFSWLLGKDSEEQDLSRDNGGAPPIPSQSGAGPNPDEGRYKSKTEKDLRRVEAQYDPTTDSFNARK
jgi:hypothetical protein